MGIVNGNILFHLVVIRNLKILYLIVNLKEKDIFCPSLFIVVNVTAAQVSHVAFGPHVLD